MEDDEIDTTTDKSHAENENDVTTTEGDNSIVEKIEEEKDDSILMAEDQGNGEENPMETKLVENVTQFQV